MQRCRGHLPTVRDSFSRRNNELVRTNTRLTAQVRRLENEKVELQKQAYEHAELVIRLRAQLHAASMRIEQLQAERAQLDKPIETLRDVSRTTIAAFEGMRQAFTKAASIFEQHALPGLRALGEMSTADHERRRSRSLSPEVSVPDSGSAEERPRPRRRASLATSSYKLPSLRTKMRRPASPEPDKPVE
ncbi:hypothetical protein HK105_207332 [Polyrhizophydium stewartii]|uniref:Shugoshin C-terminal domain-containing protein n=1 Tax=Polyrhizophydium stewartii TaxID=2732419 RepID=A0ABR4N118_9FUNG